ncbi:MAG: division/cell wall cluster transcriptional repressor MraZ, partial [Clostridia bacterium]|nr:division/cell wall cluster transcriptional repressor MraZ [Clostridia bacterium]
PEYISYAIANVSKELIYDRLCAVLNVAEVNTECKMGYFGEYSINAENGSVKLPDRWKIDGEIVLVGCGDHIEIMKKEAYDEAINKLFQKGEQNEI